MAEEEAKELKVQYSVSWRRSQHPVDCNEQRELTVHCSRRFVLLCRTNYLLCICGFSAFAGSVMASYILMHVTY